MAVPFWPFRRTASSRSEVVASILLGAGTAGLPESPADNLEAFAREAYSRLPLVYACVQEKATSAAEARLCVRDDQGDELTTGTLAETLRRPNPWMDQFEFLEALNIYLDIAGIAYVYKARGQAGQVVAWLVLRPERLEVVPGAMGPQAYVYTVNGQAYVIPATDIGVVKEFNPADDYHGLSRIHVLARSLLVTKSLTEFVAAFFQNAAIPSGLLKVKRKLASQDEADRIRSSFMSRFSGARNWHRIPVLDEDADYQKVASDLKDLAIKDIIMPNEAEVCEVFGVPPVLVGASVGLAHSTYANYAEARQSFWEETLLPRNRRIIGALGRMFAADYDELVGGGELAWDYSEVKALGENEDAKSTRIVAQWAAGLISRDEARAELGYDPLDGDAGAVFSVPSGVTLVSAEGTLFGASATPPPAQTPPQSPPDRPDATDSAAAVESAAGASRAPYRAYAADDSRTIPEALTAAVEALQRRLSEAFTAEGEAFLRHLRSRRDALTTAEWEELLRLAQEATAALYSQALDDAAPAALERGWTDAGRGLSAALPAFGQAHPAVVGFLTNYAADRVAGIQSTTRDRLRTLLADAAAQGWDYGRTSRAITAAFDGFAGRAPQEHLRNRAELIAVHEIGTAYEVGKSAVAAELGGSGIDIEKSWVTVNDDRVSAHCRDNAAAGWIPDTQLFPSGQMHAPAHPACRCATVRRVATKVRNGYHADALGEAFLALAVGGQL